MSEPSHSRVLTRGYTSTIYHHQSPTKVVKVLEGEGAKENFTVELEAYKRLSGPERPSSILQFFGVDENHELGLVFEFAAGGNLFSHIWHENPIDADMKRRVARQAIEALIFVHSRNILHCDIHALNIFLDSNDNVKLGDFGAASFDGSQPRMMYRASHQLWIKDDTGEWHRDISIASEIFALGCVLYNMESQNGLFSENGQEIDRAVIAEKLKNRDYPELGIDLLLKEIIGKCWSLQYREMADLLIDLPSEAERPDEFTTLALDKGTEGSGLAS